MVFKAQILITRGNIFEKIIQKLLKNMGFFKNWRFK